eukprot:1348467-Pyramimonas_sp.AAC.1
MCVPFGQRRTISGLWGTAGCARRVRARRHGFHSRGASCFASGALDAWRGRPGFAVHRKLTDRGRGANRREG